MGLDMYLYRMPRYRGATPYDVSAVEDYFEWEKAKAAGNEYAQRSFKEWCGRETPAKRYRDAYKQYITTRYFYWDVEHRHPVDRIMEQVGYWRKANQIHNWFVENIQDGVDDCEYHNEVTQEDLEELLDVCKRVLDSCELVVGEVINGYRYTRNKDRVPIIQIGEIIKDPSIAKELLPSTSGCFFGSTEYNEYYVDDIKTTIDIVTNVLETTDFDTHMVYYVSSW